LVGHPANQAGVNEDPPLRCLGELQRLDPEVRPRGSNLLHERDQLARAPDPLRCVSGAQEAEVPVPLDLRVEKLSERLAGQVAPEECVEVQVGLLDGLDDLLTPDAAAHRVSDST
jgi:hypothetical protein